MKRKRKNSCFKITMVSGNFHYLFYDGSVELSYVESLTKKGYINTFNGILYCEYIESIEKVK